MKNVIRNIAILIASVLLMNKAALYLLGLLNKRLKFVESVFVCYPADGEYTSRFFFESLTPMVKWNPFPVGIARQNGKWILTCVISANEKEIESAENADNLMALKERTDKLRQLLHAPRMTFSGIVPGVMYGKRIRREIPEADVTVDAVVKAVEKVKAAENFADDAPVILLGGMGFIGRRLMKKIKGNVHCVDVRPGMEWPVQLQGQRGIVVNVSRNTVLQEYLEKFWSGLVLLNEVYPEPSQHELDVLNAQGIPAYHVVGARAMTFPAFPKAYEGGIPCCAALAKDEMEVLIRKLA